VAWNLSFKDVLSPAIASVALLVSGLTFYTSNVLVDDSVWARITDFESHIGKVPAEDRTADGEARDRRGPDELKCRRRRDDGGPDDRVDCGWITVWITYTNAGNRQAVIAAPGYLVASDPSPRRSGAQGAQVESDPGTFPFVLDPKAVRLAPARIPVSYIVDHLERGALTPEGHGARRFFLSLEYWAIDSSGSKRQVSSGRQIMADVSPYGVDLGSAPHAPGKDPFPRTQLFAGGRLQNFAGWGPMAGRAGE
jgi:hypothetical protein